MTTFGCRNLSSSSSFSDSHDHDTRSGANVASSSKTATSELVLRGGRVVERSPVKRSPVKHKKSKKSKRGAAAQRAAAAAKALQHKRQVLALHQLYNKPHTNEIERQDLEKRARVRYNFVYVGNLLPGYTEDDIRQVFEKSCGEVVSVSLRVGTGKGISIGMRIPEAFRMRDDTNYALVVFAHTRSAEKALRMDGMKLHGSRLVITRIAKNLPEFWRAVERAFPPENAESLPNGDTDNEGDDNDEPMSRGLSRTRSFAPCPIPLEPTELLDGPPTANARFFGFSFQADMF